MIILNFLIFSSHMVAVLLYCLQHLYTSDNKDLKTETWLGVFVVQIVTVHECS